MGMAHKGVAVMLDTTRLAREKASGMRRWRRRPRGCAATGRTRCTVDSSDDGSTPDLTLPSLGLVQTAVLAGILRTEHGLSARDATSALAMGLLVAGYETDSVIVASADAFDIIDVAMS